MTTLSTATQSNDSNVNADTAIDSAVLTKAEKQALATAKAQATKQAKKDAENAVKQEQVVSTLQSDIISALVTRKALHEAKTDKQCLTLDSDIKRVSQNSFSVALNICVTKHKLDLSGLARCFAINDSSSADFVAVKAITKILRAVLAIAQNDAKLLDGYTQSILLNLVRVSSMNTYECYKALSKSVVARSIDDVSDKKIVSYVHSAASTASTQASSTRMMLRMLDVCEVKKASKGDILTFKSNDTAILVMNLFKINDASNEAELDEIADLLDAS